MLTIPEVQELQDESITVTDADGDCVFAGICQSVTLANQAQYSELHIKATASASKPTTRIRSLGRICITSLRFCYSL